MADWLGPEARPDLSPPGRSQATAKLRTSRGFRCRYELDWLVSQLFKITRTGWMHNAAMAITRLGSVSLDCDNPAALAAFWAELLGGEIAFTSDDFVAVKTERAWLAAVRVPEYQPPSWPDGGVPKQIHLDLAADDLDEAEAEAVRLGARRADEQPSPERWRVLLDPAGHPFCLSTQIPE